MANSKKGLILFIMKRCLVIIDVQNGFLGENTIPVVADIKSLIENNENMFEHIVATKFINNPNSGFTDFMKWNDFMDDESTALDPYVLQVSETVFIKPGYTCFTDEFESFVADKEIDYLYFVGVDTDCCVLKSAADCFERNIPFQVLMNYCRSNGGDESHKAAELVLLRMIGDYCINNNI